METLLNNLVQATGWTIFHSLWQSALIYALLLPFQLKGMGLSARLKYAVAYGSLCLMFLSFVITFILSFQWSAENAAHHLISQNAISLQVVMSPNLSYYIQLLFPYLVLAYGLGLIVQCILVFQGYNKVQQLKNAPFSPIPQEWKTIFERLSATLNIRKQVDFRLSDHVNVPLVIGYFKPVILFPIALAVQMNIKQVETILIHELSHIRRNDYAFNLIRTIINTFLFFNPFVWLTSKFITIEREHACDDLVLKVTHTPLTYAHALLTLELITDKSNPAFSLAATGNNQHLYQRIKRITDMKTNYVNSKQKLVAITLTIATIISLAWIKPSVDEPVLKSDRPEIKKNTQHSNVVFLQDTTKNKKLKKNRTKDNSDQKGKNNRTESTVTEQANTYSIPAAPAPNAPQVPPVPPIAPTFGVAIAPVIPIPKDMTISIPPIDPGLSGMIADFSVDVSNMVMSHFNKDKAEMTRKMKADIEKQGEAIQRKFNSPEQKAKWEKFGADMKAKFDSPEQRAKWEQFAVDMKAKFDNPEQRAKWDKMAKETAAATVNSPEYKEMIRKVTANAKIQAEQAKTMTKDYESQKRSEQISIARQQVVKTDAKQIENQKLKNTAEYLDLKKKFDKDVEELMKRSRENKEK